MSPTSIGDVSEDSGHGTRREVVERASDPLLDTAEASTPGSWAVLRRGLAVAPEFRVGLRATVGFALLSAVGRLTVPLLFQQVIDRGFRGGQIRAGYVALMCSIAVVVIIGVWLAQRAAQARLWVAAESALAGLRERCFAHIHRLSIAAQNEEKRGVLVSRVTNDVEAIVHFLEWGGINWIVGVSLMGLTLVAMFVYSWKLALVAMAVLIPLWPVMRRLQRGMVRAYDRVRSQVGDVMTEIGESVTGAAVVRAYGLQARANSRIAAAVDGQYRAQLRANSYSAVIFPTGDLFGAVALACVLGVGVHWGAEWGLSAGSLVAMLFLVNLFLEPMAELSESFDQTQNAIAGFRKILGVLDLPVEVVEPVPGVELPTRALAISARDVTFRYIDDGPPVLDRVSIELPAGSHVAIVGETGSGKTTFAKLLCRLADPVEGSIELDGIDLREVTADSRRAAIRLVPQDGFLFDTTIVANVQLGRVGATRQEAVDAFAALGLDDWLARLPDGLETRVGERGDQLSVGERQLVALARAQVGSPGLLVLDEATSAVDPDTEQAIARAMARLGEGRTTVAIAHRLSTAETADLVVVFDAGRIVEFGPHSDLVALGGTYARLYDSWLGNTRTA